MALFQEAFAAMQGLINQHLSEGSLHLDANVSLLALHSFKVLAEMTPIITNPQTMFQGTTALAFEALDQHKARTEYEAMGGFWNGSDNPQSRAI